ncbi:hypothetical protein LCGC14_2823640 [marine sediment metagenome]|uniref:HNH nuclease domain-containing protein n=1 Tax=marine sediment metagenome TaxID=412755 RepID=A0A0F9APR6_9ZZZZ
MLRCARPARGTKEWERIRVLERAVMERFMKRHESDPGFKERWLQKQRAYGKAYRERKKAGVKPERKLSPHHHDHEGHKEWDAARARRNYGRVRVRALMFLGGCCARCGFRDMRSLNIDHVNGNGRKEKHEHRNIHLRGLWLVQRALEEPGRYQVLCANCNSIKRCENKEYRKRWV